MKEVINNILDKETFLIEKEHQEKQQLIKELLTKIKTENQNESR